MTSRSRFPIVAGLAAAVLMATAAAAPAATPASSAAGAMRAAIVARMGADAQVSVDPAGVVGDARVFREARPDPSAWLGRPIRFTLITSAGAALPASAAVRVVADYAVTTQAVDRGHVLTAGDVRVVHGEVTGVPLGPLPAVADLVGARVLRPMPEGTTVLAAFVKLRRLVEPGDDVTVVAAAGAIRVTAAMVAADGGSAGDVIRVVNPGTRRYLRGRIVRKGVVEVLNGR
jgi:flagella basal body P-ring formation protein FlgA